MSTTKTNDPFAPSNLRPGAFIEYSPRVDLRELVALMKSFCDHVGELTSTERGAALFIIQAGIRQQGGPL